MNFVRFPNGFEIAVLCFVEPLESTMDQYVVHKKIDHAIKCDAEPESDGKRSLVDHSKHNAQPGRDGENEKKQVVSLKALSGGLMVVAMYIPQKAMHDVLVCGPSHEFHGKKSQYECCCA